MKLLKASNMFMSLGIAAFFFVGIGVSDIIRSRQHVWVLILVVPLLVAIVWSLISNASGIVGVRFRRKN